MIIDNEHKKCSNCKFIKYKTDFHKNSDKWDKLASQCKECSRKRGKGYYVKNKSKILIRTKKYYELNKTDILAKEYVYAKARHSIEPEARMLTGIKSRCKRSGVNSIYNQRRH